MSKIILAGVIFIGIVVLSIKKYLSNNQTKKKTGNSSRSLSSKENERLTEYELEIMKSKGENLICPDCQSSNLLEGPSGGGQNIKCGNCEARFNIIPYMGIVTRICDKKWKGEKV